MFTLPQKLRENYKCLCCSQFSRHELSESMENTCNRVHVRFWTDLDANLWLAGECSERFEHGGSCWVTKCPSMGNCDKHQGIKAHSLYSWLVFLFSHNTPLVRCVKNEQSEQTCLRFRFLISRLKAFQRPTTNETMFADPRISTNNGIPHAMCSISLCSKVGVMPSMSFLCGV